MADPSKHINPQMCYHAEFGCSKSNCMGIGGIPKFWEHSDPAPWHGVWLTP